MKLKRLLLWLPLVPVLGISLSWELRKIEGQSMVPTLRPGDVVVINTWAYGIPRLGDEGYWVRWGSPAPDDLVLLTFPGIKTPAVKRVIGRAGAEYRLDRDRISFVSDTVHLKKPIPGWAPQTGRIGRDQVFVLGDNPDLSEDSRHHGLISVDSIRGKVIFTRIQLGRLWD